MNIGHYLLLLRHYWRLFLSIIIGITVTAWLLSVALLFISPRYTGSASVRILPTEAELAFTRGWLQGSSFNPTNVMVQTHVENLLSRPVLEKTLAQILLRDNERESEEEELGWRKELQLATKAFMSWLWEVYHRLNSGYYVPPTQHEILLNELANGIEIKVVEGSYILYIKVTNKRQWVAAMAANALAKAYIERVQEDVARTAESVSQYLRERLSKHAKKLDGLVAHELTQRQEMDILDPKEERLSLLDVREIERNKMQDEEAELAELDAHIAALRTQGIELRTKGLVNKVEQELALSGPKRASLVQRLNARKNSLAKLNAEIANLAEKELALEESTRKMDTLKGEIQDLQDRLALVQLSQSSALSQLNIINPSVNPVYPSSPKVVVNTIVAFVGSIFIALFTILLLDTLSDTLKTSSDLYRLSGERSLGTLSKALLRTIHARTTKADLCKPNVVGKTLAPIFDSKDSLLSGPFARKATRLANEITSRLAAFGQSMEAPVVVVGYGSKTSTAEVSAFVAAALNRLGRATRILHTLHPDTTSADNVGRIDNEVIDVGSLAEGFDWDRVVELQPNVIMVVRAGSVTEGVLEEFKRSAESRQLTSVFPVLLEA